VPVDGELRANLESPLPRSLPPRAATALFCSGTASAGAAAVRDLRLLVDGAAAPLAGARMPRFDMPCRRSGFWGVIPVRPGDFGAVELTAMVTSEDGRQAEQSIGRIDVAPLPDPIGAEPQDGLIAVCMATFEPDLELLDAQLESLRNQSDTTWLCVISDAGSSEERYEELLERVADDRRFVVSREPEQIGFYRNFERALQLAPREAELVALCDQDDVWYPEKLAVLRASLGGSALVYSDSRLVARDGRVLSGTLWRGRTNNWGNLRSLLFANTVTGAAALFRREVLERALPFPDWPGIEFHDHWLALVALAVGDISYVDRPLYDYVQHSGAILGKVALRDAAQRQNGAPRPARRLLPRMRRWRAAYFIGWIPGEVRARTLLLRCEDLLTPRKRRALERHLRAGHSVWGFAWLVLRPLRALLGRNETLGAEWDVALGIIWSALAGLLAGIPYWPDRWLLDTRFPEPPIFEHQGLRRWRSQVYDPGL